jgi:hypothetical protein
MKVNESIDCTSEAVDVICEVVKEDSKKGNDIVYAIAMAVLISVSGFSLWLVWDLVLLVWG